MLIKATHVSLVIFSTKDGQSDVVWSAEENIRFHEGEASVEVFKRMGAAILRLGLALEDDGLKKLKATSGGVNVDSFHGVMSSPWSYTVSRNINVEFEEETQITDTVILEATQASDEQSEAFVSGKKFFKQLGIYPISKRNTGKLLNGYEVNDPIGLTAKTITIEHTVELTQEKLISAVEELKDKMFPKSKLYFHTFSGLILDAVRNNFRTPRNISIVDISDEVTEVNVYHAMTCLRSLHRDIGRMDLVRNIAKISKLPEGEVSSYLKTDISNLRENLNKTKRARFDKVIDDFVTDLTDFVSDVGKDVQLPKYVFFLAYSGELSFFADILCDALHKTTGVDHVVQPVAAEIFDVRGNASVSSLAVVSALGIKER